MNMLEKFVTDDRGKTAILQKPNFLLTLWFITLLIDRYSKSMNVKSVLDVVSFASLSAWIILEVTEGSSPFRRVLGAVILAYLIIKRL